MDETKGQNKFYNRRNLSLFDFLQNHLPKLEHSCNILNIKLNKLVRILKIELDILPRNFHTLINNDYYQKYSSFEKCKLDIINNKFVKNQYYIESLINMIYHNIMNEKTPIQHNYGKKLLLMCAYLQLSNKRRCIFKYKEYQNTSNLFFQILFAHNAESYIYGITINLIPYIKKIYNNVLIL